MSLVKNIEFLRRLPKSNASTALRTVSEVSSVTREDPSSARETVATETPATLATSRMVAGFLPGVPLRLFVILKRMYQIRYVYDCSFRPFLRSEP